MDEARAQGNELFQRKEYRPAIENYTRGIDNSGSSPDSALLATLYSNRAACHLALGNYSDALADATAATSVQPINAKGHSRRGAALYGLGKMTEGSAAYEEAARFAAPGSADADEYKRLASQKTAPRAAQATSLPLLLDFGIIILGVLSFLLSFVGMGGGFLWKGALACATLRYLHIVKDKLQGFSFSSLTQQYRTDAGQYAIVALVMTVTTNGSFESAGFLMMLGAFVSYAALDAAQRNPNIVPSRFAITPEKMQHVVLNGCLMELMAAVILPLSFIFSLVSGGHAPPVLPIFMITNFVRHRCSPRGEDKTYMPRATYGISMAINQYLPRALIPTWERLRSMLSAYCNSYT